MPAEYVPLKFLHILIAILSLGTSAGLGIVMELFGNNPVHGSYVLRAVQRIVGFIVIPGYVLMLLTGLWMVHLLWQLTALWIRAAMILWGVGFILLLPSHAALHKQILVFDREGPESTSYRRVSLLSRGLGAGGGLVVVVILYFMVFKPGA